MTISWKTIRDEAAGTVRTLAPRIWDSAGGAWDLRITPDWLQIEPGFPPPERITLDREDAATLAKLLSDWAATGEIRSPFRPPPPPGGATP